MNEHEARDFTIEPDSEGRGFWLVNHGEYPSGSVLEFQYRRSLVKWYHTLAEAVFEHPEVEVKEWSTKVIPTPELPHTPPAWFDPEIAGEVWDDDY